MITNATEELREAVGRREVLAAMIQVIHHGSGERATVLFPDHTEQEAGEFWHFLDFDYDSGYGTQHVFGVVWLDDGTWLERREYDGSERWVRRDCPPLPQRG